jgi:glycosyltransferase involved in cell wall biosynthesis
MRLLHVTHQYRPAIGGAEQHITDLSEELAARGHQVDVFTSRSVDYRTWRNVLPADELLNGVHVYRFNSLPRTGFVWRVLSYGTYHYWRTGRACYEPFIFYGNGPVCPGMFTAIVRRARCYDLVHINNLHYAHALVAYSAARLRHLPVVITPHLHAEQRDTHDVGYMQRMLRGSEIIFADTSAEKAYLAERGWNANLVLSGVGIRPEQFPALDPAVARARLGLPETGFVMLFLGRKTEYKGLDLCLEALARLRQSQQDVYLLAVGAESDFSQALWSRYAGLEGLVVRGEVPDEERLAALAACDVLSLPSTGEAFGIVYLEAWAYHKPVIGARISSVSSLVTDGEDGLLVEPNQVTPLVQALADLVQHPEKARAMGERGRMKLERRYTIGRIADTVEGAYARVLRKHRTLAGEKG